MFRSICMYIHVPYMYVPYALCDMFVVYLSTAILQYWSSTVMTMLLSFEKQVTELSHA
eukprot:COSAG01_NODE_2167_length_8252_cov_3.073961_1_plen_58_part_10